MFPGVTPRHDPPRLLLVVAHPDDETFGCGSLLLVAAAEGWHTVVACATRGEAGETTPGTDLTDRTLGDVREAELREASRLMGVRDVHLLGFGDSGMSGGPLEGSLAAAPPEAVAAAVRRVVTAADPDVVVTLDGSDGHRDHAAVRDAALAVARERSLPAYLQCLSRDLMRRWAEHMAQTRPGRAHLRHTDLGTPDEAITLVLDSSAHIGARERAIAAHATQASPFEGLPEELRRAFLSREHLIEVPGPALS